MYRTLALLDELDLAHEVQLGDGRGRWELAHPDEQLHLACRVCGSVTHHPGDAVRGIRDHLGREHGFTAEGVEVVVTGLCAACARPTPTTDAGYTPAVASLDGSLPHGPLAQRVELRTFNPAERVRVLHGPHELANSNKQGPVEQLGVLVTLSR